MISSRDLQLAQEVVDELRTRGEREKAVALEHVISNIALAGHRRPKKRLSEYLTLREASRSIGVSLQSIRSLVDSGQVQSKSIEGREHISRLSLLEYFNKLRQSSSSASPGTPFDVDGETAEREFVAVGFPPDKTERLRILSDVLESGRELSAAEDAELLALEREFARISKERLRLWFTRQVSS